ncbi:MAG: cobalamin-binding protein [Gammaproteobacteria bacterium]
MAVLIPKLVPFLFISLIGIPTALASPVQTTDGLGQTVRLNAPAQRIVSLAPNVTELIYAAGAGSHLVAVSSYSDWPAAARNMPRVGDAFRIDLERIVALKPDLVIGWASGTSPSERQALQRLGLPLMLVASRKLNDIARSIRRIGWLAGTAVVADRVADAFVATRNRLARTYAHRRPLSVFYEISEHPLYTVGGRQIISQVLNLCGGRNVFSDLGKLAPVVSRGVVLARKPQVILVGSGPSAHAALNAWKRWAWVPAVRHGNLFVVPAAILGRATPRLLQGALAVCRDLQQARQRIYPARR